MPAAAKHIPPLCDAGHRWPSRMALRVFREGGPVAQAIISKEITAFEGRAIGGSWTVVDGRVRVRAALGEKSAPIEEINGVWVAWRLLREMGAEGKA
jgi:hypothetical protein